MRRFVLLIGLAGALAACATPPAPAPHVTLPARYEAPPGAAGSPVDLDRWWLTFRDPQLDALEAQALAASPDAQTARARVAEARAVHDATIAGTFPTGEIDGRAGRTQATNLGGLNGSLFPIGGRTDSLTGTFDVSWEIDLFGRLAQRRGVSYANLAAALFDVDATWAALVAGVADNYFAAAGLRIQLAQQIETVRINAELESIASKKAQAGIGAATDADRVAGDLARAQAVAVELESQLHASERQLLILIGRGSDPVESLPATGENDLVPEPPPALPGTLLARRPDVLEAQARLAAQKGTDRLAHLAVLPTFTILPALGGSSISQPGVSFTNGVLAPAQQTTSLGFWSLAFGANVPVLDIPRLLYEAKAEDARTREAAIAYEKTVQKAYGEAENALVALDSARRSVRLLDAGEAHAHKASDDARRLYAMGLDDLTTALSAEQAWRVTLAALTSQKVTALQRAVQTYKALGGGWASTADDARAP